MDPPASPDSISSPPAFSLGETLAPPNPVRCPRSAGSTPKALPQRASTLADTKSTSARGLIHGHHQILNAWRKATDSQMRRPLLHPSLIRKGPVTLDTFSLRNGVIPSVHTHVCAGPDSLGGWFGSIYRRISLESRRNLLSSVLCGQNQLADPTWHVQQSSACGHSAPGLPLERYWKSEISNPGRSVPLSSVMFDSKSPKRDRISTHW
ncbi:hypothetical protein BO70DRAFT_381152 [Aspergillus heteromorphus CBS 117.55]|uniref:Uncharacterized protein n=1 Tax=Aspergillus heteromorphus CBS 117.55 TaxID=1448321 RepID=A0A317VM51_9EURO|nr:uncharacterized protein BO70DRAFT_381152 [Aspergillus heteromorphus CBS 117.55]PWY75453.1 hypothetical protein BO70DRAFT_381152 [Aspergillus heteromorphus CBS 117.55]